MNNKHFVEYLVQQTQHLRSLVEECLCDTSASPSRGSLGVLYDLLRNDQTYGFSIETIEQFADFYAPTTVYASFVLRYLHPRRSDLTIDQIGLLLPSTTPFIRQVLQQMFTVSEVQVSSVIASLLREISTIDLKGLFKEQSDPVIHFYPLFLHAYDPSSQQQQGVYYTPVEVVDFIVRSIDSQFKTHFGLPLGLASSKRWEALIDDPENLQVDGQSMFVRILDPATGTGVFIQQVFKRIRDTLKQHWQAKGWSRSDMRLEWQAYLRGCKGRESDYTGQGLLSRIEAFELMPTPLMVAHLQIGHLLANDPDLPFVFSETDSLSIQLRDALATQQETYWTVIVGNPPFFGNSTQQSPFIKDLLQVYKREPNQLETLKERQFRWLNDDYVKFIRLAEHYITTSGLGVVGYITPHGFLDNPTFRGMRWHLWRTFDDLYLLDLHGNGRKQETTVTGTSDENIFGILQGVSISLLVKHTLQTETQYGNLYHVGRYGLAASKRKFLAKSTLDTIDWVEVLPLSEHFQYHFFSPLVTESVADFYQGFSLQRLFQDLDGRSQYTSGMITGWDALMVGFDRESLLPRLQKVLSQDPVVTQVEFGWPDSTIPKIKALQATLSEIDPACIQPVVYRPFDQRVVYYDRSVLRRPQYAVQQHFLHGENRGLIFKRGDVQSSVAPVFVTDVLIDFRSWSRPGMQGGDYVGPLYRYENGARLSNLNPSVVERFSRLIGEEVSPEQVFDYVYGMANDTRYYTQYAHLLAFDYPHIPYPKMPEQFWSVVEQGKLLRQLDLFQTADVPEMASRLRSEDGSIIEKSLPVQFCRPQGPKLSDAKQSSWNQQIWINPTQYLTDVSKVVWQRYVGGYQPAQKWLKDRKGRSLTKNDLVHYAKILWVLERRVEIQG